MSTPTRLTVNDAVLAIVIDGPGHGWDVWERFEDRFHPLFRSKHPHVYRSLNELADAGHVEPFELAELRTPMLTGREKGRGCGYRASGSGARFLRERLATPIPPGDARAETRRRLRATHPADYHLIAVILRRFREAVLASALCARPSPGETLVEELDREEHEAYIEWQLRWVDGALEKVRHRAAAAAPCELR